MFFFVNILKLSKIALSILQYCSILGDSERLSPMIKEADIQIACNVLLNYLSNQYKFRHFHVANEGKKSISFHVKLKKMGFRAGVPDFIIEYPDGKILYIELKTAKGRLSEPQKLWQIQSEAFNTPHFIVKGTLHECLKEVENIVKENIPLRKAS